MTEWERLEAEVRLFARERYNQEAVFSAGSRSADIALVGEAPGGEEERLGAPFVGKAGKNLDAFLRIAGLNRNDAYITNVVKIRPRKVSSAGRVCNRPPTREEEKAFAWFLARELALVRPRLVVTLGNVALRALTAPNAYVIGETHGRLIEGGCMPYAVYPMYHPASVIYNRGLLDEYMRDLERLGGIIADYTNSKQACNNFVTI